MNQNDKNVEGMRIPLRKRFWYSITKFEKYPEMASTGVKKAIGYLAWLMFVFAIIVAIGLMIKFHMVAKEGIKYLNENFETINYQNGNLSIQTEQKEFSTEVGKLIINTEELNTEQIKEYENASSSKGQLIWLKDRVIAKYENNSFGIYYKDVFDDIGLKEFSKTELVKFLNDKINSPKIYLLYGAFTIIYIFLAYFLAVLIDILVLSAFGWITTLIAQLKMRYRAIFNMSVYSITISTILQVIYILIRTFTDFNIKYFDLMYTTISFICLAAAIFMIRSDVIKQQIELMRIIEIKKAQEEQEKENEEEQEEEKKEEPKEPEEQKEDNEERKEEPQNKERKNTGINNGDVEGSNA